MHVILTPRFSGAEQLATQLARLHASEGHTTCAVSLNPSVPSFRPKLDDIQASGAKIFVPERAMGRIQKLLWIRRADARFNPDVVLSHSVIPAAYVRLALLRKAPLKAISVLHAAEDDYSDPRIAAVERALWRFSLGVIVISDQQELCYLRRFPGLRSNQIRRIPNGIDTKTLQCTQYEDVAVNKQRLGVDPNAVLIVQVGRIVPLKNQLRTVMAIAELAKKDVRIRLWLVGEAEDPDYAEEIHTYIRRHELQPNIVWAGSRPDIATILGAADLFVMPSEKESQGIAMLEAIASGVSIVASRIEAFSQLEGYEGVRLISLDDINAYSDAIELALKDRARWARDVAAFDIQTTANRYMEAIADFRAQRRRANGAKSER